MTLEHSETALAEGLLARPVTMNDLEAAVALFHLEQIEHYGKATLEVEDLRNEWETPGFVPEESMRAVFTSDGLMIGHIEIWDVRDLPVRPHLSSYVHPEYRHLGVDQYLIQWGEQRSRRVFDRVPAEARVVIDTSAKTTDTYRQQLLESMGFVYANRSWWNMLIEMDAMPPDPVWPEGITITTHAEFDDIRAIVKARLDSFRDHRGFVEEDFENVLERTMHQLEHDEKFEKSLLFVALNGDTVAGVSLCRSEYWDAPDEGYLGTLGVVRDYRNRGLGKALLLHTFQEFYKRGTRKVCLHVDGSSITGATRLYESAGMHVRHAYMAYEKEIRPGIEMSNQG
ncbi:MAG: GNAT family N-acetyltransferase [Anaerolineae bacterium]